MRHEDTDKTMNRGNTGGDELSIGQNLKDREFHGRNGIVAGAVIFRGRAVAAEFQRRFHL